MTTQYLRYSKYSTLTTYDVIDENPLRFPGVTICNHNPFKKSYVESIPKMAEVRHF